MTWNAEMLVVLINLYESIDFETCERHQFTDRMLFFELTFELNIILVYTL